LEGFIIQVKVQCISEQARSHEGHSWALPPKHVSCPGKSF